MITRSRKDMTTQSPVNQPVTSRQCAIAFCDNSEQLVNICCKNCEDKKFCQKHYMCMSCYVHLLRNSCENKRNPVCPLDRSELAIDPMMKRMVECDVLLDGFWSNMDRAAAEFAQIRAPYTTPVRIGERRTVRRISQGSAYSSNIRRQTPPGVSNVREAMNAEESPPVEPLRFPFWTDEEGNVYQTNWPNATTTNIAIESVQSLIDIDIAIRDLDDEAANGFHDPNA